MLFWVPKQVQVCSQRAIRMHIIACVHHCAYGWHYAASTTHTSLCKNRVQLSVQP